MPAPVRGGQRYLPGLDGLRALAVLAVVAYHLNLGWAQGGLLGVGVFFTLSGYLITDLLLGQQRATGSLQMADFWLRRARRLLPALFLVLAVVVGWVDLLDRAQLPALRGAAAAAAGYVSNWWLIAEHSSYFAQFGPPSPLGHLWSLAVEEQFYLVWPFLLWLGLRLSRGRRGAAGRDVPLAAMTLLLAAGSAAAMMLLYHPGYDPTRVYDGTDTRAFGLLVGAATAFLWPSRRLGQAASARRSWLLDGCGALGLAGIVVLVWRTTEYSAFLYRGGLVLLSVATAAVVLAAAAPASRIGALLGWRPLRWVGVRSYGIYLWHYPIIVLTTPADGSRSLVRAALQVAACLLLAALSWRFVEEPVRHGAIGRFRAQLKSGAWPSAAARRRAWLALGGTGCALVLTACSLAGVHAPATGGTGPAGAASGSRAQLLRPAGRGASPSSAASLPGAAAGLRSSCRSVVHIGDSTSDGLFSADYLPDPALRITAQYRRVGVTTVHDEVSGGRSIVETILDQPNAYAVAQQYMRQGYHGCWVLALGTNDTANVYVGGTVSVAARIRAMMSLIGNEPVLWVNVISLLSSGPYSEHDMRLWNQALLQACPRYPSMRVYDWADAAQRSWFISDGIHYTSAGYAARAARIADALAAAFPATGQPASGNPRLRPEGQGSGVPSCLVF